MSRCFPYPPPGFELKTRANDLDVIESIKREREKTKKERRKEKKEKKEKKEGKKKNDKSGENGEIKKKKRSHEKRQKLVHKAENDLKRKPEESEQLEKSCLTEEKLASTQNLYDSSDSTQNSNKRKRLDSNHINGTSIFIRLPLVKHKDPELPPSKEHLCCTSGRTEIIAHKKHEISPRPSTQQSCSTSGRTEIIAQKKDEISPRPSNQQACSTSGRNEVPVQDKAVTAARSHSSKNGSLGLSSPFIDLIENWVPPMIQQENMDFDDQEWLFERKQYHGHEAKRFKPSEDELCQRSSSLWPRACYLPSADTYILPYTVPY